MNCPDCLENEGIDSKMVDMDSHYLCLHCGKVVNKE